MTYEEKLLALKALAGEASVHIRRSGDWYVSVLIEIGGDGLLRSIQSTGTSPQEAIETAWRSCTELPRDRHLRVPRSDGRVFRARWNGYMWEPCPTADERCSELRNR